MKVCFTYFIFSNTEYGTKNHDFSIGIWPQNLYLSQIYYRLKQKKTFFDQTCSVHELKKFGPILLHQDKLYLQIEMFLINGKTAHKKGNLKERSGCKASGPEGTARLLSSTPTN